DHERYSLVSEIHQGDNAINLALNNPSADDNLFLAVVNVSAGAVSPEPATMALLGSALLGIAAMRFRRQCSR
ncbi:MAG TPA: PEP-CTERM sorting domain-containing protein, partial [Bryobacteraceae bacterium]|nr:PEP-CTERM sorting domain-containing protein [Bryobacteraceae bacterium]